jgi:MFS family permease
LFNILFIVNILNIFMRTTATNDTGEQTRSIKTYRYALYAVTVFASSFLLFQVQPLISKHILPWFGGSSSVWITAMFFFMVTLAAGYIYAMVLTWFSRSAQVLIHSVLLVTCVMFLLMHTSLWPSAITPMLDVFGEVIYGPTRMVLFVLLISIGLPFFLLSASSSLLQHWYGDTTGFEPFSLYAVSNTGSLFGLLSYPVVFERVLTTSAQGTWWMWGMFAYIGLMGVLMSWYLAGYKLRKQQPAAVPINASVMPEPSLSEFVRWVLLASVPVATMLAGTSYITGYMATVPFLWIIPLGLYLTSFIVSFHEHNRLPPYVTALAVLIFAMLTVLMISTSNMPVPLLVGIILISMFSIFHLCHETLYQSRPPTRYLTRFYVALSIGGIVASVLYLISSLYILPIPIELIIILTGSGLFSVYYMLRFAKDELLPINPHSGKILITIGLCLCLTFVTSVRANLQDTITVERNFFGYKAVLSSTKEPDGESLTLVHGTTNHGYQFVAEDLRHQPLAYYGERSGIGKGFAYMRSAHSGNLRVAVAGLGAGAIAAYCKPALRSTRRC